MYSAVAVCLYNCHSTVILYRKTKGVSIDDDWAPGGAYVSIFFGEDYALYTLSVQQGWKFAHRFSERIARFLRKNERMSDSFKKRAIRSFAHFFGERPEQIVHGRSLKRGNRQIAHFFYLKKRI